MTPRLVNLSSVCFCRSPPGEGAANQGPNGLRSAPPGRRRAPMLHTGNGKNHRTALRLLVSWGGLRRGGNKLRGAGRPGLGSIGNGEWEVGAQGEGVDCGDHQLFAVYYGIDGNLPCP
ncbi:hypothetical protein chiPu_0025655 [Chiloscyllium punctatum]|uniref:Uncharacterized protein n=1 Tax=Chiloscyllium punctatum TaxID=137246 RepID=A0A401TGC0_CHIPU|nr:hypothetical protein [Chiloscyllium punctatum]